MLLTLSIYWHCLGFLSVFWNFSSVQRLAKINSTVWHVPFPALVKVFGASKLSDLNLLFKIAINRKMIYHLSVLWFFFQKGTFSGMTIYCILLLTVNYCIISEQLEQYCFGILLLLICFKIKHPSTLFCFCKLQHFTFVLPYHLCAPSVF